MQIPGDRKGRAMNRQGKFGSLAPPWDLGIANEMAHSHCSGKATFRKPYRTGLKGKGSIA
eukprot:1143568-Pelagomonas_calceolata.AAC.1